MSDPRAVVIGGGITGLAAAERLVERLGPAAVLLLEAEPRVGGRIVTETVEGCVIEGGPDCFLGSKPAALELCRRLGVADRLVGTDPRYRRSFVKRGGRLHQLPEGMSGLVPSRIAPLLSTGLLSMRGRARAALELLVPRREADDDESIADFARRRFGVEAYDWLIEPLLGGIHAGDGEALSLPSTFPQLARLERQRGSVLRAMLAPRFARSAGNGAANPGFLTLPEGLGGIVAGLERRLGDSVRRGARVTAVQPRPGGFDVILAGGELVRAEAVVVTAPAHAAADLLAAGDPALARELRGIPFVSTATVSLAFDEAAVPPLPPGYGYVSARAEGGAVVACSWTSRKFPARTPAGRVLLRLFVGRAGNEGAAHLDDGALLDLARAELRAVLNITAAPVLARVFRWPRAMPQYVLGHGARLARIDGLLARWPGLLLAGASYRGAGIPDCVASGWAAADAAAPVLAAGSGVAAPAGAA